MALNGFTANTRIESSKVNANFQGLADGSEMSGATIDELSITTLKQVSGLYNNGNSGASKDIDWSNGDRQKVTISASTTLTFSGAIAGQILTLLIIENSTGGYTVTLPTLKWPNGGAGTLITTANAINVLTVLYDGTNYLAVLGPGFA